MNKKIAESLNYLLKEYKRLKKKREMKTISKPEEDVLKKLSSFLGNK